MQSSFGLAVDDPYTEHEDGVPPGRENSPVFFHLAWHVICTRYALTVMSYTMHKFLSTGSMSRLDPF